ncbi:MAG: signal peptidase I [Bacteroidales bacterium]|nr:signal peptidase I [Bacteroidales bacterium]
MEISLTAIYISLAVMLIGFYVGLWTVFKKAGRAPWHALIPLYNIWAWLRVIGRPWWWLLLFLMPAIAVFMFFLMIWKTIRLFGKTSYLPLILGTAFFFVYLPYLGISEKEVFTPYSQLPKFKKSSAREWGDAIIFAVAAAYLIRTFMVEFYAIPTSSMESSLMVGDYLAVGKMDYGARLPMTPLAVPFVHHTIPGTKMVKSYVEWIKFPYLKAHAFRQIERGDVVVFNYPDGDTVAIERQNESYYAIVREFETLFNPEAAEPERYQVLARYGQNFVMNMQAKYPGKYYQGKGRDVVKKEYHVVARPVDKRENYVKRCVAVAGDKLQIIDGQLYINDKPADNPTRMQFSYLVSDPLHVGLTSKKRKELDINEEDCYQLGDGKSIYMLNNSQVERIEKLGMEVVKRVEEAGEYSSDIFPHDARYAWNKDNFGPFTIPAKGVTVPINDSTIVLYDKIIENYELNTLEKKDGKIYINGVESDSYTFKMDYYFMMGDNRHNSADSRFWGVVPENHVVGKALFVWLSIDKFKEFGENKIRFDRMFKSIGKK